MKFNPYFEFAGTCEEALRFYEKCLGGSIIALMRFGETPAAEHVPASHKDKIMHGSLAIGDQFLMASDDTPEHPAQPIKGCSVALHPETPEEAERVFKELSEGGTVTMPLAETFWALRFGMLTDRFGVPWMINCSKPH